MEKICTGLGSLTETKNCLMTAQTKAKNDILQLLEGFWTNKPGTNWNRITDLTNAYYNMLKHPRSVQDDFWRTANSYWVGGDTSQWHDYNINNIESDCYNNKRFVSPWMYGILQECYARYWNIPEINHIITSPVTTGNKRLDIPSYINLHPSWMKQENVWDIIAGVGLALVLLYGKLHDSIKSGDIRDYYKVACQQIQVGNSKQRCISSMNNYATYSPQMPKRRAQIVGLAKRFDDIQELIDAIDTGLASGYEKGLSPEEAEKIAVAQFNAKIDQMNADTEAKKTSTKTKKLITSIIITVIAAALVIIMLKMM